MPNWYNDGVCRQCQRRLDQISDICPDEKVQGLIAEINTILDTAGTECPDKYPDLRECCEVCPKYKNGCPGCSQMKCKSCWPEKKKDCPGCDEKPRRQL
ncbi:hypothetical protein FTO70_03805 [Methanosarcina sp. KYL-1]|uniref:hypothetical protein n=1 Tax=Methanosarcina sp. KYL-1 TaxID=2602068 RepID=UPI00210103F9|nr:hypothetical protein [Methanosarcina sp. KYL-1]MCQ1534828.1 hypothetical protein [Methanosarcina sp. KYL-1]